jgi:hypothetical protein
MMDQLKYLEGKMYSAAGLTDVALGQVDVQVAQSGIALAIKFMPTLARIEDRDTAHTELLHQMFHDLLHWFEVYDPTVKMPHPDITIDKSKLPADRVAILNELNNMFDRKIISRKTYRARMADLGYHISDSDEEKQLSKEAKADEKRNPVPPPGTQAGEQVKTDATGGNNSNVDNAENQSNNQSRTNESSGTEANQTAQAQAKT